MKRNLDLFPYIDELLEIHDLGRTHDNETWEGENG